MVNALKLHNEFKNILKNYRISEDSQDILKKVNTLLLLAPSASGRNTVIKELLKTGDYHFIVSDTTRKPRVNNGIPEKNGDEYWFRKENDFLRDLKLGKFLEAEIIHNQQVSGISMRELKIALTEGKIAVTDIDIGGANTIIKAKPDAAVVLLIPPNFKAWMERLKGRGNMSKTELNRRLKTAQKIYNSALREDSPYHIVVNDDLKRCVEEIHNLEFTKSYHEENSTKLAILQELRLSTDESLSNY